MSIRPIILAEDNDTLRRMYSDMLESTGFRVMRACDGEKAIGLLHKIPNPLLIILDVMMPRMDGIETCSRVRKMQGLHPCPILFLTALDNPETLLECLRAGGDDYLVKSAPMTEVLDRVQYWARKGSSDEHSERRNKAIKELEQLADEGTPISVPKTAEANPLEESLIDRLDDFAVTHTGSGNEEEQLLFRFGYLVGIIKGCMQRETQNQSWFNRLLRNLVFKTDFVDRKEIDALIDNYGRIVHQSQFQMGLARGREDAPGAAAGLQGQRAG